ncbi:MAG: hypothetical protein JNL72_10785 [Flavipsychrobacter sp.]|nr:hypothetical protein [Flavipsychrobacter sp.]
MARIVIVRSNEYINRYRGIHLFLNNEKLSTIWNDETLEFEVPDGEHSLVAKIDWCGSPVSRFHISGKDTQVFRLSGFRHSKMLMPVSVGLFLAYVIMQYFFHHELSIFFILPLLLVLVFYISIGRNQYLTLAAQDHGDEFSAERVK